MNRSFRNDICVQTVAKVDWVDVITVVKPVLAKSNMLNKGLGISKRRLDSHLENKIVQIGKRSPLKITVHNSKEDLQKQVDGIDQHRQQV